MNFISDKLTEALFALALIALCQWLVIKGLYYFEKSRPSGSSAKVTHILKFPLSLLLWFLLGLYLLRLCVQEMGWEVNQALFSSARRMAIFSSGVWIFFRWKKVLEDHLSLQLNKPSDQMTLKLISRLITIATVLGIVLIILPLLEIDTTPLLALGGVGAASFALASKDVIANFCTGIFLSLMKPFVLGDEISLPEKNITGTIQDMGWFTTSLKDRGRQMVYLPNNVFSTLIVVNNSRKAHALFERTFKIIYTDISQVALLTEEIKQLLKETPWIDAKLPLEVYLKAFDGSGGDIVITAYAKVGSGVNSLLIRQQEVLMQIHEILQKRQVSLAIPLLR
ncbi:mechanosensitive ion channel family protein [Rhabdochlamydiaceae symbiont of Dictyostelium giganteum]|uniref:mechanosensitive ion channel family protein n=1 Tax=Rhabdochlamydiaceae symbiont of Dictyostelium giganteum TaxID=3342349 RepID=UPI00384EC41F